MKKTSTLFTAALTLILGFGLAGCNTIGQPKAIDPATGRIPTQTMFGEGTPVVIKSEKIDLKKYKSFVLALGGDFFRDQTVKLGYFDQVVDREGMEKLLIQNNKSDIVSDVTSLLSWKKIADNYKPFIVLKPDSRSEGNIRYFQLKVIQADTATEVFISEVKMDFIWKGVNDDTVFYPLYNSFLTWMDQNK